LPKELPLSRRSELQVPFGAVYFRKSNPPREDWDRDYGVAAADGLNIFRHWFMWAAIERAPGKYDWDDYDRQMDLAAKHGIRTIIAELTHTVPDWAMRKFAHARQLKGDGTPLPSIMGVSSATGGFANNGGGAGALTMNCPEVKEAAGAFLTALATRYRDHPGMFGYDVWNETNYSPAVDYNSYTKAIFREWLKAKYGTLDALAEAWHRYGHAEWDDVEPPIQVGPYPECLDWLAFKRDNFYGQMQWRIDTIRAVDSKNLICAHSVASAIPDMAAKGCDDWLAASKVEVFGYTWIQARKGSQSWRNFYGGDMTRAASRGKPFWHAERQGGPLWMQPQVLNRDKEDGRVAEPEDIRVWSLTSFAAGARGMLNLRYRPLLDGPLFGAFGSYGMDGSRTPRSEMAASLARWTNAPEQKALVAAMPVRGDIGLLVIPEAQAFDYLLSHEGNFDTYAAAMWGAYRGFFDNNIQADWVLIDDIADCDTLYAPYPISLTAENAAKLARWVESGGTLISEACPGYFGDRGRVGTVQPNHGLDAVFGTREVEVEFMPDIANRYGFVFEGNPITAGGFLQAYEATTGTARGDFRDGRLAVVEHAHGKGRTLLVGTHPSVDYYRTSAEAGRRWFAEAFAWTGKTQRVRVDNPAVQVRVHEGDGRTYLWFVNATREPQAGRITAAVSGRGGTVHWPTEGASFDGRTFVIPARDALIVEYLTEPAAAAKE
jgi:beta-galactosidase